ncbi:hypothetical protein ACFXA3_12560 [Streptomyces sp. NPDC059456]|uniref:hypothetical protein n=1 Tax=Streptomyces sp. NPDC059456 TaxID=3346838 RepID=UPI003684F73B
MRKVKWATAAAGVMLLAAGCGSESGSNQDGNGQAPTAGSSAPAAAAGAAAGGTVDAAAVKGQTVNAVTAAGFTEQSGNVVPANLTSRTVSWTADAKKVSDSRSSHHATVATLAEDGRKEIRAVDRPAAVVKSPDRSGWTLKASHQGEAGALLVVSFIATETSATCAKAFQGDLARKRQ